MVRNYRPFALALLLLAFFLTSSQQFFAQRQATKLPVDPITLSVTVRDKKGDFVLGLDENNFQISVENTPAKILSISSDDVPVSVGLVIDVSASTALGVGHTFEKNLKFVEQAISKFLELNNSSNEYFLIVLDSKPHLAIDWTTDRKSLLDALSSVKEGNSTSLFDGCYLALNKVQQRRHAKRVLVVLSDGMDNTSRYTFNELFKFVQDAGVPIYAINLTQQNAVGSSLAAEGAEVLHDLSEVSGGAHFRARNLNPLQPRDTAAAFEWIAADLRNQYSIAIEPPQTDDGKWHRVEVKVLVREAGHDKARDINVRTRKGFYRN